MAKEIDFVRLLIIGDTDGPSEARFVYKVCDTVDTNLQKVVHYEVDTPVFTLNTMQGGNRQPFVAKLLTTDAEGNVIKNEPIIGQAKRIYSSKGISPAQNCYEQYKILNSDLTIRKLTPKECFRLMGFLDDEINLDGLSNSQRYKLAGNGWDINVVSKIFKNMLKSEESFN